MSDEIKWLDETVGRDVQGNLVLKHGDLLFICDQDVIRENWHKSLRLEAELRDATQKVNAREPALWIDEAVAELERRGDESDKVKNIGQSQGYRDAAGVVKRYYKANPTR